MGIANGKNIRFPDSDNRFDSRFVEIMLSILEENNADIAVCDSKGLDETTGEFTKAGVYFNKDLLPDFTPFNGRDIPDSMFQLTAGWAWNKMYKLTGSMYGHPSTIPEHHIGKMYTGWFTQ